METRANHVLIGMFTLIVAALAVLFALWAAKYSSDKNYTEYNVIFHEAVTGLTKGGIVQYNGIAVGEVLDLKLDEKDPNRVIVRIRVGSGTPVKIDTEAKLAIIGLTGVLQIQLSGGTPSAEPLLPKEGQKLAEIEAKESALSKLLNSTADIATTATNILLHLNRMLSDDNIRRITLTLDHIETVTGTVATQKSDIADLLRNARTSTEKLDHTLASANSAMGKLDHGMTSVDANLPAILTKIDTTLTQLEALSTNANGMIAENREAIAAFGNQGLTQIGPTVTELRALLRQLNRATERLQDNPAGFVLGHGKPKEFVP